MKKKKKTADSNQSDENFINEDNDFIRKPFPLTSSSFPASGWTFTASSIFIFDSHFLLCFPHVT